MVAEDVIPDCPNLTMQEQLRNRQVALQVIRDTLLKAQSGMKQQADKNRSDREFAVGDMVYLKIQPYRHTSLSAHNSIKLQSNSMVLSEFWRELARLLINCYCPSVVNYTMCFMSAN